MPTPSGVTTRPDARACAAMSGPEHGPGRPPDGWSRWSPDPRKRGSGPTPGVAPPCTGAEPRPPRGPRPPRRTAGSGVPRWEPAPRRMSRPPPAGCRTRRARRGRRPSPVGGCRRVPRRRAPTAPRLTSLRATTLHPLRSTRRARLASVKSCRRPSPGSPSRPGSQVPVSKLIPRSMWVAFGTTMNRVTPRSRDQSDRRDNRRWGRHSRPATSTRRSTPTSSNRSSSATRTSTSSTSHTTPASTDRLSGPGATSPPGPWRVTRSRAGEAPSSSTTTRMQVVVPASDRISSPTFHRARSFAPVVPPPTSSDSAPVRSLSASGRRTDRVASRKALPKRWSGSR